MNKLYVEGPKEGSGSRFKNTLYFFRSGSGSLVTVTDQRVDSRKRQRQPYATTRAASSYQSRLRSATLYSILTLDLTGLAPAPAARSLGTCNYYILTGTGTFYSLALETGLLYQTPRTSTSLFYVTQANLLSASLYFRRTGPKHDIGLPQNRPPRPITGSKSIV